MSLDPAEEIIDEYFEYLADRDVYRAPTVLSWFTDYIDSHNENAIYKLLQHSLAGEAVAGLVDLLEFDDKRLTESVVHILGTIVEHPRCRQYVLEVPRNTATTGQNNPTLFTALVNMLMSEDKNVVMNAAGTIANIAESADGRLWILQQAAFDDALPILGLLSVDSHQWAASNSALVIARLTLSQEGVVKLLTHDRSSYILTNLCLSLCGHNPGSSMNAAFAVGRLLEREDARGKLLAMKNFKNTMTAMTKMLYNKEAGPRKNACFAFSCLANSKEGHGRLLGNVNSELILDQLVRLITDKDDETAWFAAVTLRSVCSQKEGVFRLRDHKTVYTVLKKLVRGGAGVKLKAELLTEVRMTLDIIGKLPKLPAPILTTVDSSAVAARWDSVIATVGSKITYQLYQGCTCVYEGSSSHTKICNLKPFTSYVFRVRATSAVDEGPYSGPAIITTNEGVPGSPGEVSNEGKPQHNSIKISWSAPPNPNGTLTGYNIYSNGERVAVVGTDKLQFTVRDLPHSTSVPIQIAAVTSAGEGDKSAPIMCSTLNLSDYPPRKPILSTSGGANEINVSWIDPPKQLGAVDHYELVMNGEVIFSGKEQSFRVSNLEPLAEYTFNVRVVTVDDYVIESEAAKKKAGSKVVQKGGTPNSSADEEAELPDAQQQRTPTPEIAKPVSEAREIIRPKKKPDRFTPARKAVRTQDNNAQATSNTTQRDTRQGLATIEEVVSNVRIGEIGDPGSGDSRPGTTPAPAGVSDIIVTRHVPPNTAESSDIASTHSIQSTGDPREVAIRALRNAGNAAAPSKMVQFSDEVRVNTAGITSLPDSNDPDSVCSYVPNVVTTRVKAFDPLCLANVSDTAISVENKTQENSIDFLVNYVTSYQTKSENGNTITFIDQDPKLNELDQNDSAKFVDKAYKHALSDLEKSVESTAEGPINSAIPDESKSDKTLLENDSTPSKSDISLSLSNSDASRQKIALTSLSSILSLDLISGSETSSPLIPTRNNAETGSTQPEPEPEPSLEENDEDEDITAVYSLSDIQIFEKDRLSEHMTIEKKDNEQEVHGYKKYNNNKFSIDDVRKKDNEIEEQNKLINALITQQNNDLFQQNKRTKEIIDTVRKNIRNSIHDKRVEPARQLSSNKFLHAVHAAKKNVKLSSVNMNMFGNVDHLPHHQPRVLQVSNKSSTNKSGGQKKKKGKRKKGNLPPLERGYAGAGPITKDIQFTFPKL